MGTDSGNKSRPMSFKKLNSKTFLKLNLPSNFEPLRSMRHKWPERGLSGANLSSNKVKEKGFTEFLGQLTRDCSYLNILL